MNRKFGFIIVYLLTACILLEDALPCFSDLLTTEWSEVKCEKGADEGKEKEGEAKDFFKVKDKSLSAFDLLLLSIENRHVHLLVSDAIPPSAGLVIFSPPPELG
ncbi:MAG: hypothetical protein JNJ57_01220 [Saprospiraceae bacterium]|nr:hypothetical protein [Saprospiraceae bacterium]